MKDEDRLKERQEVRKAILDAATEIETQQQKYCGHRNIDDLKYMGRGNAFAHIQAMFQRNTGKALVFTDKSRGLEYSAFQREMQEINEGKMFNSCGGKRYPLWTRSAKAAAEGLRKYAAKNFKDLEEDAVKKIAQQKQALQLTQEKNAFIPKIGNKDKLPIKL